MSAGRTVDDVAAEWDAVSAGWEDHHERLAAHTRPVTQRMLEMADLGEGDVVLDVAAGLGELSRRAAAEVGGDGAVICSDVSAKMVEAAERHGPEHPHEHSQLTFESLDAQSLALDDDSVDAVMCKMGLMLLPDAPAAAAECRRVLRPGGRFVAATWGALEDNMWLALFGAAMLAHGHELPGDPHEPGGVFSLSHRDALRACLEAGGFDHVEVESVDVPDVQPSFDDYWRIRSATSGPLTVILAELDADDVDAVRATCEEYAAGFRQPDGTYRFPGKALVAVAS